MELMMKCGQLGRRAEDGDVAWLSTLATHSFDRALGRDVPCE